MEFVEHVPKGINHFYFNGPMAISLMSPIRKKKQHLAPLMGKALSGGLCFKNTGSCIGGWWLHVASGTSELMKYDRGSPV